MVGFVSIVGAGPWNPELLTLGAKERLQRAEVVVADYLVNPAMLLHCPPGVRIHQRVAGPRGGAELDQDTINTLLVQEALAGHYVVRLKGGDPCMFGRGGEEAEALVEHGIGFEFVPGVSSPIAAPEFAGIPVTHRNHTPAVTFVSGYEAYEKAGLAVAWEHLAQSAGTLVLMMSVRNARTNAERLVAAGRAAHTPAAVVRWGTRGIQQTVVGTLRDIADRIDEAGIRAPAVLVIGDVVGLRSRIAFAERRPLFGHRIVVTRSVEQSDPLARALAGDGADVVPVPCLAVVSPEDNRDLDDAVASLARDRDALILSSPNGVEAFFAALDRSGGDLRRLANVLVAAVGDSTAAACRARGLRPDLVPTDAHSEGLVAAIRDHGSLTRQWIHVRAAEGRDALQRAIEAAGGSYRLAIGYRTVLPSLPPMLVRSLLPSDQGGEGFDAVCFASGKTAEHFVDLLAGVSDCAAALRMINEARVVTIGPVTTRALGRLGIRVSVEAEHPSDAGMAHAVRRAFAG